MLKTKSALMTYIAIVKKMCLLGSQLQAIKF